MEITPAQAGDLTRIAGRYELRLILAFGSRAAGRVHPGSDLDLAILPAPDTEVSTATLADLTSKLSAVFPGVEVDVSCIPHSDALFLKKIFETAVLLYGNEREFRRYRIYAFRRYSEYRLYLRQEAQTTKALVHRLRHAD